MNDNNAGGDRQMVQGNWTCSECGGEITELPFQPDGERPIFCKDCHQKRRDSRDDRRGPRQMVQGNWTCADCGIEITQLPFEPDGSQPVLCKACYLKKRGN